jgi:hypothetical protein
MKTIPLKQPKGGSGKELLRAACDAEPSVLLDFLARGRRAQEAVDRILAAEADRSRSFPPKRDE